MSPPFRATAPARYPREGAWRLHRAPTQLGPSDGTPARDRFDDPLHEYRVRYLATTVRGAMLEVLDHLRPNDATEIKLSKPAVEGIDILEEEPAGLVPERWLSQQRLALGQLPDAATFVDVNDSRLLAELNEAPRVRAALTTPAAQASLGKSARLDEGTIRMVGPIGRPITQAVSREVHDHPATFTGISYRTRFDDRETCWAVFDDRVSVLFAPEIALDNTEPEHVDPLHDVALHYRLTLPPNWQP